MKLLAFGVAAMVASSAMGDTFSGVSNVGYFDLSCVGVSFGPSGGVAQGARICQVNEIGVGLRTVMSMDYQLGAVNGRSIRFQCGGWTDMMQGQGGANGSAETTFVVPTAGRFRLSGSLGRTGNGSVSASIVGPATLFQGNGQTGVVLRVGDLPSGTYTHSLGFGSNLGGTWSTDLTLTELCPADFNDDGTVSVADIFDFLGAWFVGELRADSNHSGSLSVADIFDFLDRWFTPCV